LHNIKNQVTQQGRKRLKKKVKIKATILKKFRIANDLNAAELLIDKK